MKQMDSQTVGRLRPEVPGLTGLRFVAAFSVALAHGATVILTFGGATPRPIYWIEQISGFGMTLFFVLSGFVIHYNYRIAVTRNGIKGLSDFVWARFSRLYPLYFLIVAMDVLLGQKMFQAITGSYQPFSDLLRALPYYLTFTQSWLYLPIADSSLIYSVGTNTSLTWSISTEWFFYLAYPIVALFVIRTRRPFVTIAAAFIWCVLWIALVTALANRAPSINTWAVSHFGETARLTDDSPDSFYRWLLYFSPYLRIGEFILGCIISQLYLQLQDRPVGIWEQRAGSFLFTIAIFSVVPLNYETYSSHGLGFFHNLNFNFVLAPSVALVIFCAARYDTVVSRVLNSRQFEALGNASYSIYLIHLLIFSISASLIGGPLPLTPLNAAYLTGKFFFLLGMIIIVALGMHAYIEVPARDWLRSLWRSSRPGYGRLAAGFIFAAPAICAAFLLLGNSAAVPASSTAAQDGLRIVTATYGQSCGVRRGNATSSLGKACNGKDNCDYTVDVHALGDPASGCSKDFAVVYRCGESEESLTKELPAEAGLGSHLKLLCSATPTSQIATAAPPAVSASSEHAPGAGEIEAPQSAAEAGSNEISVQSATYGANCGAPAGNATSDLQMTCDGEHKCQYTVDVKRLGNPAQTCAKEFTAIYNCGPAEPPITVAAPAEAGLGSAITLSCESAGGKLPAAANWKGMRIISSTYGGNCGAPVGNATSDINSACSAKTDCDYKVDVSRLRDSAPGCAKSFFAKYQCGGDQIPRTTALPGEAGLGSVVHLSCH